MKKIIGASLIFLLDIFSKRWAYFCCKVPKIVNPLVSCELAINRGVSWSMFHSENTTMFVFVSLMIAIVIGLLGFYTYNRSRAGLPYGFEVLVLTGALGNMLDRFLYHGVVDFIVIGYGDWFWPTFNIADIAIVVGVFGMIYSTLCYDEK